MSDMRASNRVHCDIMLNKVQDGHTHVCRATNISLGGIRIQKLLEPLVAKNERVRLQLALPGESEPIWVGAHKVYEEEDYVGLKFSHISHQHFVRLREWVMQHQAAA